MSELSPLSPPLSNKPGNKQQWGNLPGAATALTLVEAARQHDSLTLVVTADTESARRLESEMLFFASGELPILHLPDWETLPYDNFSPHQDIVSERLRTLYQLPQTRRGILVVPVSTLMHRLAPLSFLQGHSLMLKPGDHFPVETMRRRFENAGYLCVETVYEHGEFAIRGSLVDIFPMGTDTPYRIDLFDEEVETLRTFDPETQRSIDKVEAIELLPAREYPIDKAGIAHFRDSWHQRFDVDHKACSIYQDISAGISPAGIEYYLPLFFDVCSTLFDYLPASTQAYLFEQCGDAMEQFWRELSSRYDSRCGDLQRPILRPAEMFLGAGEVFGYLNTYPRTQLHAGKIGTGAGSHNFACLSQPEVTTNSRAERPLAALENYLLLTQQRVLFCAESAGRREALLELLQRINISPEPVSGWQEFLQGSQSLAIAVSPLDTGCAMADPAITLITESQLLGERIQQRRRRRQQQDQSDQVIRNLTELRIGAPVVHIEHGVGRYRGMETLEIDGQKNEFLTLEYANGAKLYVPVASLDLISRYSGADDDLAPLHRLGSDQWQKARRKAAEQVRDAAAELLDIYARRAARQGFAFDDPAEAYERFAADFPFEETADQQSAIEAVCRDMMSKQPMDRLVCGDVGFGKTEVAMRAAFIAAFGGKQVAMLVPTTLLAQQHYENFRDRFADWPIKVDVISRFRSGKETQSVQSRLADGKLDIIIGTHKLLQSDLNYKNLGLLIIDEEHRFGVAQKEKLKSLRSEVDILTLTATPIPRTLNMAMSGIRDLSIIATPPAKRLSVKTFVRQSDDAMLKEAILREILRGGQVYYLHNEVKSIEKTAREIQELVPEARVITGHGQMRERQLEQVMSDFYHKRFNVLVCTTIIETGIDVPNANTIIIDRADKFGLAQLHQLRGRVGRSHHQAYAYLLTPHPKSMTTDAVKRLEAIASTTDLGAGFTLATHDLEIRGAGELLGDEQSGQMQAVGFTLYMDMLDRAVKAIQRGETPNIDEALDTGIDVNLRIPALIPEDYLPDVHTRLMMYKRISGADSDEGLRELQVEMIDRFGLLPEPLKNLFRIASLKLTAKQIGIRKLEASATGGRIEFAAVTQVDPLKIVKMVQTQPQKFRLESGQHFKFTLDMDNSDSRLQRVTDLLQQLSAA
ncbi:transcription-repair coupling factor [Pseudomaricurvus sp. HS19]|uniref:transcription-repair coupling factor n=1 Tax=Pseudomaricurvus sp. HS19 TaxID=2692626 RepID=UPI00137150AA|nr:transcription-repair coupling factor [Pseudomaricurvus sp. HS19]MYM62134.1 transcription-repair coupling factor [Pseudomaricurvus sp. HS19]